MNTDCKPSELLFQDLGNKPVVVRNDAETTSSDGGMLLLREIERRFGIIQGFAECYVDSRVKEAITYSVKDLLLQRVFGLCLGYEDLNDHERWRYDPTLLLACEREADIKRVAGKSTLNRLELSGEITTCKPTRYKKIQCHETKLRELMVDNSLDLIKEEPEEIVIDVDTTDAILYGTQEGRFFNAYYDDYCYQPLYVFLDDLLLVVDLHTSDHAASHGVLPVFRMLARKIRERWQNTRVIFRGDSAFGTEDLMAFCEKTPGFYYVFGYSKNKRLLRAIAGSIKRVEKLYQQDFKTHREFRELRYRTRKTWSKARRVVGKAEHLEKGSNPRFVVTNLDQETWPAQKLYEDLYCARGNMENRIKEQKLDLFSDRTSTNEMQANQQRMWFSAIAYHFMVILRRLGLAGTELATARASTIRLKLLKVAAVVRISVRRVRIRIPHSFPYWNIWETIHTRLIA